MLFPRRPSRTCFRTMCVQQETTAKPQQEEVVLTCAASPISYMQYFCNGALYGDDMLISPYSLLINLQKVTNQTLHDPKQAFCNICPVLQGLWHKRTITLSVASSNMTRLPAKSEVHLGLCRPRVFGSQQEIQQEIKGLLHTCCSESCIFFTDAMTCARTPVLVSKGSGDCQLGFCQPAPQTSLKKNIPELCKTSCHAFFDLVQISWAPSYPAI